MNDDGESDEGFVAVVMVALNRVPPSPGVVDFVP
jgi:hypothetical protein